MTIKIDFHIHTLSKAGKDNGFIFSLGWLKEYVKVQKLDAIAITNHNLFSETQFKEINDALECTVLPGIELSLKDGHVNIVFENSEDNRNRLAKIAQTLELGAVKGLSIEEFKEKFSEMKKGIIIFEYGKSNSLVIDEDFNDPFFRNYTLVRGVGTQLRFQKALLQDQPYCPVLFSDGHATEVDPDPVRNDIVKLGLKNTFVQMEKFNFNQLLEELKNKEHVQTTKDGLSNIFEIDVENNPIAVSTKLNLIVGRRGSGKTYLLDHIQSQYENSDNTIAYIRQFKSNEETKVFLDQEKNRIANDFRNRWVENNKTQLDGIVQFYKTNFEDQVEEYLKSVRRFANEFVSSKVAKEVQLFSQNKFEILDTKQNQKNMEKMKEVIEARDLWQFISGERREIYLANLISAYRELRTNLIRQELDNEIKEKVNNIVEIVKNIVVKKTAIQPVSTLDIVSQFSRYKEKQQIELFMKKAIADIVDNVVPEYSYKIHVVKEEWKSADDFIKNVPSEGRTAVKGDLVTPYINKNYLLFLKNLFSDKYLTKFTLESGLDLSRYLFNFRVELLTEAGTRASGGQQMALGLMMKLDDAKKADIVLVDEPEGSLDNVFIKCELIPKLRELSGTIPVFVITHNSTLGALLNPDRLIIAKFNTVTKKHELKSGDFLSKEVFDSDGNVNYSYEDFVDAMEAGYDTYVEKGNQYGYLKH